MFLFFQLNFSVMNKIIFILFMLFSINSQVRSQKPSIGVTFGSTFASYKSTSDGVSITSRAKPSATIGLSFEVPMGVSISFRPALNYVQKGGNLKMAGFEDKLTLNYLELPANLTYNVRNRHGAFFVGGGPSLSMGLSGKDKWAYERESGSDKIKFGKNEDLKKFEAGLNVIGGYQARSGLLIAANYNRALSNVVSDNDGFDSKFYNRYFGLRVGYVF